MSCQYAKKKHRKNFVNLNLNKNYEICKHSNIGLRIQSIGIE